MRKQLLQTSVFVGVFSAMLVLTGCTQSVTNSNTNTAVTTLAEPTQYELVYYPTQCNTVPWFYVDTDTAGIETSGAGDQLTIYYADTYDVAISAVEFGSLGTDVAVCQACGCPTGATVTVTVNTITERDTLLDLGFQDADTAEQNIVPLIEGIPRLNTEETVTTESIETTNEETTSEEVTETSEEIANDTSTEIIPTEQDQALEVTAERIQASLVEYYAEQGAYPAELSELLLSDLDTTGITYTPIGTVPASYYDLAVEYSTGSVVLNP